jgi:hypothetical protein
VLKGESNSAQAQEEGQASLMSVEEAEFQGLVDVIEHGEQRTVLVTDDHKPVKISVSGEDVASEVTRLQDDEEETPVAFAPVDGEVVVTPGEQPSAVHEGQQLTGDAPDDQPPVTTVRARYSEDSVFLSAQVQDDSGVRATYYRIGEEEPKAWEGEIEVSAVQLESLRYASIDVFGNAEAEHEDIYIFSGFFSPVDNPDVLNQVKAGSAIPVKFGLSGDQSLDIFAKAADGSSYPRSAATTCDSTDPADVIEQTVTAGQSGLSYDATTDRYTYVWKTSKEWRGCRQLVMKLNDGSSHRANFKFTK